MRTNANTHDVPMASHGCLHASVECTHGDVRHAHVTITDENGHSQHFEIPDLIGFTFDQVRDNPKLHQDYVLYPPAPTHRLNLSFELGRSKDYVYRVNKTICDNMNSCERHASKEQATGNDMPFLSNADQKIVDELAASRFTIRDNELPFMLHDPYGNVVSIDFNDDAVVLNDRSDFSSDPMYVPYSMFPHPDHMAAVIRYCMRQIVLKG